MFEGNRGNKIWIVRTQILFLKNSRNMVTVEMERSDRGRKFCWFKFQCFALTLYHPSQTVCFYISSNGLYSSLIMYRLCSLKVKGIIKKRGGQTCIKYAYFIICSNFTIKSYGLHVSQVLLSYSSTRTPSLCNDFWW